MNVELAKSLDKLVPGEPSPFLIIDIREQHEREYVDFPKYTKKKAFVPRMDISLENLVMGYYP